ncbi:MAG: hypothetical protein PF904_13880 [Kiritimatiellae bacterium]|jgi:hypothetical protein|nr:hypothetical protein [Kiritimatiellia bacterium]
MQSFRLYFILSAVVVIVSAASADLIVHMDFNDTNGVSTLVNSGTANVTRGIK